MKHAFFVLNVTLALCLFGATANGDTITWASGASGNWSNPSNWNPAEVPGPADTAIINAAGVYTVVLDTNTSVSGLVVGADIVNGEQTLFLNGQSFNINGPATVKTNGVINLGNGYLTFDSFGDSIVYGALTCPGGGTLSGVLNVASNGAVNLISLSTNALAVDFAAFTLTNYGTVNWSNIDLDCSSAQIENYGLWDVQSDNTFYGDIFSSPYFSTFNNYGTVRKDGGDFSSPNYVTRFDSETTFNNSGTVDVETGGLNILTGNGGGVFNTATNAGLSLGNFTLTGDSTFTGLGAVQGTLFGNNGVIHGSMAFDYGSFSGTLTVATDGVVNLVGIRGETTPIGLNGLSLTNCGTVVWSNIDLDCSGVEVFNYGLWDAQSDNTFYGDSTGSPYFSTFNNYGTVRKDGGDFSQPNRFTVFDSSATFNNYGTVDIEIGLLEIYTGSGGGIFNTATGGNLDLAFYMLDGDVTFTGPGYVQGYPSGDNAVIHGALNYYWGTLSGTMTVASNAVVNLLDGGTPIGLNGLTLTNCGTVLWSNIDLDGTGAQVFNYGLWDAQSDNTFYGDSGGGPYFSTFNNYGTVRKDGGSLNTTFDNAMTFNNYGTLDVETSTVNIGNGSGGGLFNAASNAAIFLGNLGSFTLTGDTTFTGPGTIQGNVNGNNGIIHGSLIFDYGYLSGTMTVASNAVANLVGIDGRTTPVNLNGLSLTNCGTVVWSNVDLDGTGVQVFNHGLWDAQSDNTFYGDSSDGPYFSTFNNYGTVRKDGGSLNTTFDNSTTFNNFGTLDVETSTVNIGNGSGGGLFNAASNAAIFLGNLGSFTLTGDTTFTGPGQIQGNVNGNNGIIHGSLIFDYGYLSGTMTVASNAVVNLLDGGTPIGLNGLTLTNCGTVLWSNIDLDGTGAQVFNYGLWDAQSDNTFYGDSGGGPYFSTFNNYGIVRKDGGSLNTTFDNSTTFNNFGTLDVETSTVNIGNGSGGGLFNAASNAAIFLGNLGSFTLTGDTTFTGPGQIQGYVYGNNGIIHGSLIFDFGTLSGTMTVASGATANLVGIDGRTTPINLNGLSLTNCGTVVWSNIDLDCSGVQVYNHGLWDALSGNTFYGDIFNGPYFSTFNNYGTVRKDGQASVSTFDGSTTYNNYGKTDVQIGQVTVDGSSSLTNGTLNFGISGPSQNGQINFPDGVQLAGKLSLNLKNHYTPAISNSFPVVLYSLPTGTFTSLCLPPLASGLGWQTNYTSSAFTLSVVGASPLQLSSALSLGGGSMSLSWDGLLGQTYQVQCTTNLAQAIWANLGEPITGTNGPISVLDSITNSPNKYYRIESQ